MRRSIVRLIVSPLVVAFGAITLGVACEDEGTQGCRIDTDCAPGFFCRGSICGLANPDSGLADVDTTQFDTGAPTASCSSDGVICTQPSECCSTICEQGRCATSPSSTPLCRGLYEICQNDCCAGFTCTNGTCR